MAIACLRDVTLAPLRPLLSVPRLRLRIALSTFRLADSPYFRVRLRERARRVAGMSTPGRSVAGYRKPRGADNSPREGKTG